MKNFVRKNHPGQGHGYKPPMDPAIFRWLAFHTAAIVVLASVLVYTVARVWAGG